MKPLREIYRAIVKDRYQILREELRGCQRVLDLGCGASSPLQVAAVKYSLGVDASADCIKDGKIHSEYLKADVMEVDFEKDSFDAVIGLEIVEHLPKDKGLILLKRMEKWASKKVIISTPNGFVPQSAYDGNIHQVHLSGWVPEDFNDLGYRTKGFNGLKQLSGGRNEIKFKPLWFWLRVADMTQLVTYRLPSFAFEFYAIKDLNKNDS